MKTQSKIQYELKRDWQFLGGPESEKIEKLPAGTPLGVVETYDGSHMTPQQLCDAVCRGLAGPVHASAEEEDAAAKEKATATAGSGHGRSKSKVKDE